MEINKERRRYVLYRTNMKRICSLCLTEQQYFKVKKWKTHPLQLCTKCRDAIITTVEDGSTALQSKLF